MRRILITTTLASLLALGCGRAAIIATPIHDGSRSAEAAAPAASDADTDADAPAAPRDAAATAEKAPARAPGDYVTYRFSGAFRRAPITLTQRIVAREGSALVLDLTLSDEGGTEALRVRMSDADDTRREILSAARLDRDGAEQPATLAAYEALMAKTALAADANEGDLGDEAITVEVGGAPLACRQTSYRVRIGKGKATMRTIQSDSFAWGDVGGEITAEDGRVLYRAEVIEAGRTAPEQQPATRSSTLATSTYDE